jgi:hypothetical protein
VHDNVVTANSVAGGAAGIQTNNRAAGDTTYFLARHNVFVRNTYNLRTASATPFVWMLANRTESQWTGYGEDVPGRFLR